MLTRSFSLRDEAHYFFSSALASPSPLAAAFFCARRSFSSLISENFLMFSKKSGDLWRVISSLAFFELSARAPPPWFLLVTGIVSVRIDLNWAYLFLNIVNQKCLTKKDPAKNFGSRWTYLTRFSDAMTLVETAFPRACNWMVSWISR